MNRARARSGLAGTLGAAAVVAAVLAAPAAALAAPSAPTEGGTVLEFGKPALISAGGAAVQIPFAYSCPDGQAAYVSVSVVQALGEAFASGSAYRSLTCTGERGKDAFYLQANTGQGLQPFRAGAASILARLESYPAPTPCENGECEAQAAPPSAVARSSAEASTTGDVAPGRPQVRSGHGGYEFSEVHGTITLVASKK